MSPILINKAVSSSPLIVAAPAAAAALLLAFLFGVRDAGPARLDLRILDVADLPGWSRDDLDGAAEALQRSCRSFATGQPEKNPGAPFNPRESLGSSSEIETLSGARDSWSQACAALLGASQTNLRDVLEREFFAVKLSERTPRKSFFGLPWVSRRRDEGLLTGYFEPEYEGARRPTGEYSAPVLARPDDLVTVDLGAFREDLAGRRIAGRVVDGRLTPFEDRAGIEDAVGDDSAAALAWLRPEDAFFLQIQGSGRVRFDDGGVIRAGYDGHNGHPYTAIGRTLVARGDLDLETVSMQTIRDWLRGNAGPPAAAVMRENRSYVFFRDLGDSDPDLGPLGGSGLPLTPRRSIAIDPRFAPYGAPVWIDGTAPAEDGGGRLLRRLFVAQDEGGAIKGPLRGDVFWGHGDAAGGIAGRMRARAVFYLLLPNALRSEISP